MKTGRKKAVLVLASLLSLMLTGTVLAVTIWQTTQTISQTIEEAATGSCVQTISLPKGYKLIEGQYTESDALTVTTKLDNMELWIAQTEEQMNTVASMYSNFVLHVVDSETGTDVIIFDMRTQTSASTTLATAGAYTFDYYFEYTPANTGIVSLTITVTVTK